MERKTMKVAIVGCGMIAERQYAQAFSRSRWISAAVCCDLVSERAEAMCDALEKAGLERPRVADLDEIVADDDIDLVMNLTNPKAHFPINMKALEAGKHVFAEKPLAVTREEGRKLLETAAEKGVRLGCAPDTILGWGQQTARAALDSGRIGAPSAATMFIMAPGPDGYHEDPEFFFQEGAGPLFDMGVYYVTASVHMFGPVNRVTAFTKTTFPERKVLSEKKYGQPINVEVPTHVTGVIEFKNGVLATIAASFDVVGGHNHPKFEIYGTEGSMDVPDPNTLGGETKVHKARSGDPWETIEATDGLKEGIRGFGAAEIAAAVSNNRPHRTSAEMSYHVLDVMHTMYDSAEKGCAVKVESAFERPAAIKGLVNDIED